MSHFTFFKQCRPGMFFIGIFIILFLGFLVVPIFAAQGGNSSKELIYELSYGPGDLKTSKVEDFDAVALPDTIFTRDPGKPQLPLKVVHFVIDSDKTISEIRLISDETMKVSGQFNVYPAQESVRLDQEPKFTPPDVRVYGSAKKYPDRKIELKKKGLLGAVDVATVHIYPLEYLPAKKQLILHTKMKLKIILVTDEKKISVKKDIPRRSEKSKKAIRAWLEQTVANPQDVIQQLSDDDAAVPTQEAAGGQLPTLPIVIDYLIITNNALRDSGVFNPLIDSKVVRGLSVYVETVENIAASTTGRDLPEKIRNYIKQVHLNNGLTWVLLGGDTNIVPVRYVKISNEDIPSDMYFSDLDGNWDANANNIFGEFADNLDLYPDVIVGRAPVENEADAQTFVYKVLTYETHAGSYFNRVLLLGTSDFGDAGGQVCDLIEQNYLPADLRPATKYYQRDIPGYANQARDEINTGYHLINHIDHANIDRMMFGNTPLVISDFDGFTNRLAPSIITSCGCWPAALDYDAIAEHWITNSNGGGVAFIGDSRSGWHPESDQMLIPELYKSLFLRGMVHIGQMLADAKITFIANANDPAQQMMRYAMLELNLLGDPEMTIVTKLAAITSPVDQAVVEGTVQIIGSTPMTGMDHYELSFSAQGDPQQTTLIVSSTAPVTDDVLGVLDTSTIVDGWYILMLKVVMSNDSLSSHSVQVYVNNTHSDLPPRFQATHGKTVNEGQNLQFTVTATDPEEQTITLSAMMANGVPLSSIGATFIDNGNGTGSFQWTPAVGELETLFNIVFTAMDSAGGSGQLPVPISVTRAPRAARLLTPDVAVSLSHSEVTFTWDRGINVQQYAVCAISNPEQPPVACSEPSSNLSATLSGIPITGSPITVDLWSVMEEGVPQKRTYTYQTVTPTPARILTPDVAVPLNHSQVTFTWDRGVYVEQYAVCAISNPEQPPVACSEPSSNLSATLSGIPITGSPITVKLWSVMEDGPPQSRTYTYQTVTPTPARILEPNITTPLSHSEVKFTWDQGVYVEKYAVCAIWNPGQPGGSVCSDTTSDLGATLTGIPITGSPITVKLWSVMEDGPPQSRTYTYQTRIPRPVRPPVQTRD